jgi:hypothetical protein
MVTMRVVSLLLAFSVFVQAVPDFSGTWTLDQKQSTVTGGGTGGGRGRGGGAGGGVGIGPPPERLAITQDAENLIVEERGDRGVTRVQYSLTGQSRVNQISIGGRGDAVGAAYRSKWDGSRLVTTIDVTAGQGVQLREVRSLRNDGAMVVETVIAGRGGRTAVYSKAPR